MLLKAKELVDSSPGEARRNLEEARIFLGKNTSSLPDIAGKSKELGAQISAVNEKIDSDLKSKGLVLFNYKTFTADVLGYHQKKGHILIGRNTWINPEQLCKRCSGSGEISCAKCQGYGKANKKCEKCQDGRITCRICDGSGYKPCNACNGVGAFIRTCSKCGGSGMGSGYYSYPSGPNLYLSSGAFSVSSSPWFSYPTYTARTCSACGGSGNISIPCSNCGGSGSLACPKTEKCGLCKGAGYFKINCPDCDGKGRLICPACFGKGYKGEAQKYPGLDGNSDSGANAGGVPRGTRIQTLSP